MEACVEEYCAKLSKTGVKLLKEFIEETFLLDKTDEERFSCIKSKFDELLDNYPLPVIRFIDFDTFEKFGSCPRYPDNKEVTTPLSEINRGSSLLVFISHCWMRGHRDAEGWDGRHHPDNAAGDKFKLIVQGIKILKESAPRMSHCYIWLDFGCVNQDKKSNLKDELERYDKIVECCDAIFTPIVDHEHESWDMSLIYDNLFVDYKAKLWNNGPHAYLHRAWCRLEMLYAANIPVLDNSNGVKRHTMFEAGLAFQCSQNRRPHYLYGTREYNLYAIYVLPPLQNKFLTDYHPIEGHLSVAEDVHHVKFLLDELKPYIDANTLNDDVYKGSYNCQGQKHGFGHYKDFKGFNYEGEYVNDKATGKGKLITAQGDVYEGQFENNFMHGYGVYKCASGNVYEGGFCENLYHGCGVLKYANGNIYKGIFSTGKQNGQGVFHAANGAVYSGDFVDNQFCGNGTLSFPNGDKYIGDFKDSYPHGKGILTHSDGDTYEGDFIMGSKDGEGVLSFANGTVYEGSLKKDHMHGLGKYFLCNGSTFEGSFVANKFCGYGVFRDVGGETYRGDFNDDKRHGRGVHTFVNGIVYQGDIFEDMCLGNGTYLYPNGDVFEVNNLNSTIKGLFKCSNGKVVTIHYDERNLWTLKKNKNKRLEIEGSRKRSKGSTI